MTCPVSFYFGLRFCHMSSSRFFFDSCYFSLFALSGLSMVSYDVLTLHFHIPPYTLPPLPFKQPGCLWSRYSAVLKCWHHVSINKLFPPTDCWRNILGLAEVVWWVAFPMLFPFSLGSGLSALVVCSASENDTFLTVSALCLPKLKWKYKPNLKLFGWCQFRINSKVN